MVGPRGVLRYGPPKSLPPEADKLPVVSDKLSVLFSPKRPISMTGQHDPDDASGGRPDGPGTSPNDGSVPETAFGKDLGTDLNPTSVKSTSALSPTTNGHSDNGSARSDLPAPTDPKRATGSAKKATALTNRPATKNSPMMAVLVGGEGSLPTAKAVADTFARLERAAIIIQIEGQSVDEVLAAITGGDDGDSDSSDSEDGDSYGSNSDEGDSDGSNSDAGSDSDQTNRSDQTDRSGHQDTERRVTVLSHQCRIDAGTTTIVPGDQAVVLEGNQLRICPPNDDGPPINRLLQTVASAAGPRMVAVVLSGSHDDGGDVSSGVRRVHHLGGLVLVEDPETAVQRQLPQSALAAAAGAEVLEVQRLFRQLSDLTVARVTRAHGGIDQSASSETDMSKVFELLQARHGIDFALYKRGTIERRLQRRLQINGIDTVADYVKTLETNAAEVSELYQDLLIGVTKFFRDSEAFTQFKRSVVEPLVTDRNDNGEIRIWVAACASGEEAYSIAILMDEEIRRQGKLCTYKIFATDAHQNSLRRASAGLYQHDQIEGLSPQRLQRYFKPIGDRYQINGRLRDRLVFAPHNVLTDPPFTRIDVVTCRNMLIYFLQPAQRQAIRFFHFSLRSNGYLWLGASETVGSLADEFQEIDKRWRIYRKRRDGKLPFEPVTLGNRRTADLPRMVGASQNTIARQMLSVYDQLLSERMPPSLLINADRQLLHVFGSAQVYLTLRPGRPSSDIIDSLVESLRIPAAGSIDLIESNGQPVRLRDLWVDEVRPPHWIDLSVRTIVDPITNDQFYLIELIRIDDQSDDQRGDGKQGALSEVRDVELDRLVSKHTETLSKQLADARAELQHVQQQSETMREELQATNEELDATNSQLRSAIDKSMFNTEQLRTLNAQHHLELAQSLTSIAALNHFLDVTPIGALFLDDQQQILRFTKAAGQWLSLKSEDIGRHVDYFLHVSDVGVAKTLIAEAQTGRQRIETVRLTDQTELSITCSRVPAEIDGGGYLLTLWHRDYFAGAGEVAPPNQPNR